MSTRHQEIFIGLPETGKTTYLAALWHVVCVGDVQASLKLVRLHGDQGYLNKIREQWAKAEVLGRTNPKNEEQVSMILADSESDAEVELCIPDLSGESFESDWAYRRMSQQRAALVSNADGALLFINPARVVKEVLITEVAEAAEDLDDTPDDESTLSNEDIEPWNPLQAPTQVQLVDLLQFLIGLNNRTPLRVAAIVSAWDLVPAPTLPNTWLESELPLLCQFIRSNSDKLQATCFGVSAQGGDLGKDAEKLQRLDSPSTRIQVVDETGCSTNDITLPIRWLMNSEN